MAGLGLLLIFFLLIAFLVWFVPTVTQNIRRPVLRGIARILLTAILIPVPVLDEVVGYYQFSSMCEENAYIHVDRFARGKTVYSAGGQHTKARGTWLPIRLDQWNYVDVVNNKLVFGYVEIQAQGGLLFHLISEGDVPLIFSGRCLPKEFENGKDPMKSLRLNVIERDEIKKSMQK